MFYFTRNGVTLILETLDFRTCGVCRIDLFQNSPILANNIIKVGLYDRLLYSIVIRVL